MRQFILTYYPLIIPFALYLPLSFIGYGSWPDIYLVLDSGTKFLNTGIWTPSRNPGYFIHEFFTLILNYFGGNILSNLGTTAMAILTIASFIFICKKFEIPHYKILAITIAFNPFFWINAASTIDHIWAIGFILAGFALLLQNKYPLGGLILGLSVGSRLSSFIAAIGIFVFLWLTAKNDRQKIILSAVICGISSILFYLPSFINANYTFNFLNPGIGGPEFWTPYLRLGRFVYKNIYFWGLPAFITLIPIIFISLKNRQAFFQEKQRAISWLSIFMIAGYEALYFKYPIKPAYLLPLLPFAIILLGVGLKKAPKYIYLFSFLLFLHNFINFNIANPDIPGQATGAKFQFTIEAGYLVQDVRLRLALYQAGCDSEQCALKVYKNFR